MLGIRVQGQSCGQRMSFMRHFSQGVLAKTVSFIALVEIIRDCVTSLPNKDASQYCCLRHSLNYPSHLLCLKSQRSPACKYHMDLSRGVMGRTW